MRFVVIPTTVTVVAVIMFAPNCQGVSAWNAKSAPIGRLVRADLAEIEGYQPGDVLSRERVGQVIAFLQTQGVKNPNADAIILRALAPDSLLLKMSRTERGRRFLRQIGKIPGGYGRLERLARLPQGKVLVRRLERDPGGATLIEYLATTSGGRELGKMLANSPQGVNPNQSTDRIYTADDLISALEKPATKSATGPEAPGITRNR